MFNGGCDDFVPFGIWIGPWGPLALGLLGSSSPHQGDLIFDPISTNSLRRNLFVEFRLLLE